MLSYISGKIKGKYVLSAGKSVRRKLSECTTYGLGGAAEIYYPENILQARAAYDRITARGHRPIILGNGSNVLASDAGTETPIICTKGMRGIYVSGTNEITCLAGTMVGELVRYCISQGKGGVEYLAGIPATIGGLACMNGGAGGKFISENIISVRLYVGKTVILDNKSCQFSYKHSTMRDINAFITDVTLKIYPSDSRLITEKVRARLAQRGNLPTGRSCGCVFKNPSGNYAARLIEGAGLKGLRLGGANVSTKHANFILNSGGRARDVRTLIAVVRAAVFQKYGVRLQEEVVYIGDFNDSDG